MPIYEYLCCICDATTEKRYESSNDAPKTINCVICGNPADRIFSSFSIGSTSRRNSSEISDSIGTLKADVYKVTGAIETCPHGYQRIIVNELEKLMS